MRVLTWNLFHGRSVPESPRSLFTEFAMALDGWEWDVALLQEVPPWWGPPLGRATGASVRTALTSRNALLPLRRVVADRRPDLIKSNGGGANAILVRGQAILDHRVHVLRLRPERRVVHGVALASGTWVVNLHAQVHSEAHAQADLAVATAQADAWSGGAPTVLGGDTNTRTPIVPGFTMAGGHNVDHVLVRGLRPDGKAMRHPRHGLSDHDPVSISVIEEGSSRADVHDG